jgi:hypothetical protein
LQLKGFTNVRLIFFFLKITATMPTTPTTPHALEPLFFLVWATFSFSIIRADRSLLLHVQRRLPLSQSRPLPPSARKCEGAHVVSPSRHPRRHVRCRCLPYHARRCAATPGASIQHEHSEIDWLQSFWARQLHCGARQRTGAQARSRTLCAVPMCAVPMCSRAACCPLLEPTSPHSFDSTGLILWVWRACEGKGYEQEAEKSRRAPGYSHVTELDSGGAVCCMPPLAQEHPFPLRLACCSSSL